MLNLEVWDFFIYKRQDYQSEPIIFSYSWYWWWTKSHWYSGWWQSLRINKESLKKFYWEYLLQRSSWWPVPIDLWIIKDVF